MDKKTARKIIVEKKIKEAVKELKEHRHTKVVNLKNEALTKSHSKHLI